MDTCRRKHILTGALLPLWTPQASSGKEDQKMASCQLMFSHFLTTTII